jgi:hypothetical protein
MGYMDQIYIVRDYDGNLRLFLSTPVLTRIYKKRTWVTKDFYGEDEVHEEYTDEYLHDDWICPIYPEDKFDQRRYGFVVDEKIFSNTIFSNLKHTDEPVLISKKEK